MSDIPVRWHEPSQENRFLIGVCKTDRENTHAAIVYISDQGVHFLLHLAFHCTLIDEQLDKSRCKFLFVKPNLTSIQEDIIIYHCRRIAKRNPQIMYGFNFNPEAHFNGDGNYIDNDSLGLSCSTFITAVFRFIEIELVDINSWKHRDEDEQRFKELYSHLESVIHRKYPDPSKNIEHYEHLDSVRGDIHSHRVRPEECAAAAQCDPLPASFATCAPLGALIKAQLPEP